MDPKEYLPRLQQFLDEIAYSYTPPSPPSAEFLRAHHHWVHHILGPMTSWTTDMLTGAEIVSATLWERVLPFADAEMKFILARLTAIAAFLDDSLTDKAVYDDINEFACRAYLGEAQPDGVLALFYQCLQELSKAHEGDAVLRCLAVTSWFTFPDTCLLEKRLLTVDPELRASPQDMGFSGLVQSRTSRIKVAPKMPPVEAEVNFPMYLRDKSGFGEAFAAAIFKASKDQELPLSRFVKAFPDLIYYIEVINDLLSFHKEQLAGETVNMISLQHQSWRGGEGTGLLGEWTMLDTYGRLCDQVRDATLRIDKLLRLEECEMVENGELRYEDVGLEAVDVTIAMQWREYRYGYISWHLECPRYKLEFMRPSTY